MWLGSEKLLCSSFLNLSSGFRPDHAFKEKVPGRGICICNNLASTQAVADCDLCC